MVSLLRNIQRERLVNAVLYFALGVKFPFKVKIFKLLFLLDFLHFRETGLPVTDAVYCAWDFGPVPKDLFEELDEGELPADFKRLIRIIPNENEEGFKSYRFTPAAKARVDFSVFTPRQKRILDELIEIYKTETGKQMSKITHLKNSPWDLTKKQKGMYADIDYLMAIDDESGIERATAEAIYQEHREFLQNFK